MDNLKNISKNGALVSSLLGLYYLFVFAYKEQMPFPLDISVLPTMVIALGMLSLLFTFIAIIYSSISVIVLTDPMKIDYESLIISRPKWIRSILIANILNYIIFFCFTPILLLCLYLVEYDYASEATFVSLFSIPILYVYYALTPNSSIKEDKFRTLKSLRFWKAVITFFYIGIFSFLSVFVYLKYLKFSLSLESDFQYFIALTIFFIFSFFILLPARKRSGFQINADTYSKNGFAINILRVPAFYIYSFCLILTLIPAIAYNTASVSFKFLNIGGGIERSYYFYKKSKITIPPELIKKCDNEGYCLTKPLNVTFDLGGVLYVKEVVKDGKKVLISLPKQHLYMIKPLK